MTQQEMNSTFLCAIRASFCKYLDTTARSNEKLKILHGAIAKDLEALLNTEGEDKYRVESLGIGTKKEGTIEGRYMEKKVDILVRYEDVVLAGIAVKFVMSNYAQNSNNYFENMLGETANIRARRILYFQILVIPEELPYYERGGTISKVEKLKDNHMSKYLKLSQDDTATYFHAPDKALVSIISLPKLDLNEIKDREGYKDYYKKNANIKYSKRSLECSDSSILYTDYGIFMNKTVHLIKSRQS